MLKNLYIFSLLLFLQGCNQHQPDMKPIEKEPVYEDMDPSSLQAVEAYEKSEELTEEESERMECMNKSTQEGDGITALLFKTGACYYGVSIREGTAQ